MEVTEGTEEDRKFEASLNSILHMDKKDYPAYVGGLKVASGHEFPVASPVDNSIIFGTFQEPEEGLTDRAVIVAKEAFAEWSAKDPSERMAIFDQALENIIRQKYRIAALVTLSSGMTRDEALDEVERLIEVIYDGCQDLDEGIEGTLQAAAARVYRTLLAESYEPEKVEKALCELDQLVKDARTKLVR
jgi:aldehyde dehydrogenase (NAD+)/1-pyrroline-5-carboxylate dehydrogenase